MKKMLIALCLAVVCLFGAAQAEGQFAYRFADAQEGAALLLANDAYYSGLSQQDLDYRMQKKGATLEEYKAFAAQQVLSFTEEEKQVLADSFARIEAILQKNGYVLPAVGEIVLIKTTMLEESGAGAYTHKNQIYLGDQILAYGFHEDELARVGLDGIICHELFHCLTRFSPEFRAAAYGVIGFTVQEEDFPLADSVREALLSNPDVEHHNAFATFRIGGEDRECYLACVAQKPFEKEGDQFFSALTTVLVPLDSPETTYAVEEAENFWEVFGENTGYVIDPEECLADNFRFAVVFGADGLGGMVTYPNPEIIQGMIDILKP